MPSTDSYSARHRIDTQPEEIWHKRLGHLNERYVSLLPKQTDGIEIGSIRKYKYDCDDSLRDSQCRQISRPLAPPPSSMLDTAGIKLDF